MFGSLDVSTSALVAQRVRLDTIASNMANAQATRRSDGQPGPYRRRMTIFETGDGRAGDGVHVSEVREDPARRKPVYLPDHPHAIQSGPEKGCVEFPNVDMGTEMVNAMLASRAYEANIAAMEVTKSMMSATLRLLA